MDTNINIDNDYENKAYKYYENKFTIASMVLGTIACLTSSTFFLPMILGSIGIILAILSKGKYTKMSIKGKLGFHTSLCSILLTLVIFVYSLFMLYTNKDYQNQFNTLFKQMYGVSAEDFYQDTITDYDSLLNIIDSEN